MANSKHTVSVLFDLTDRFSGKLGKLETAVGKFSKKVDGVGKKMSSIGKGITTKFTLPLAALGGLAIKQAANIETMQVAFESLTGSTEQAEKTMKSLIKFTAKTPFQMEGVGKAAKQLLAFEVTTDELESKLKFLGDIAAGANVPLSEMAAIFGKSKAKGKAMTEELLQLSDKGIPIIGVLSKQMGVSKDKIFEMASKSKISFEVLEKALISMTQKGGMFADQMEKQSATLAGRFSTLKDNIGIALGELGKFLIKEMDLKKELEKLTIKVEKFTESFKAWVKENKKLARFILLFIGVVSVLGAILTVLGPVIILFAKLGPILLKIVKIIPLLIKFSWGLLKIFAILIKTIVIGFAKIMIAGGPILWIITAIAIAAFLIYKNWGKIKKFFLGIFKSIGKTLSNFWGWIKSIFSKVGNFFKSIWDSIVETFKELWRKIKGLVPQWLINLFSSKKTKKQVEITTTPSQVELNRAFQNQNETDVNIKVTAEDGSVVEIGKVKNKKGNAKVKVSNNAMVKKYAPGGSEFL